MEYKQIEAFLAIAEFKNITKAAESLFMSQSALSYRLKTLEDELGVVLVERNKGVSSISLTSLGEEFLEIAEEWHRVHQKAAEFSRKTNEKLIRIAAPSSVHQWQMSIYSQLSAETEQFKLSIITGNSEDIAGKISKREADIGFGYIGSPMDRVNIKKVYTFPFLLIERSQKHRNQSSVNPADLDPHRAVLAKGISLDNPDCAPFYKKWFGENVPFYLYIDTPTVAHGMIPENGWCLIPETFGDPFKKDTSFQVYNIDEPDFVLPYYMLIRSDADKVLITIADRLTEMIKSLQH